MEIAFFGFVGVVLEAELVAHLVKQLWRLRHFLSKLDMKVLFNTSNLYVYVYLYPESFWIFLPE
jgi:hypothetical protein